MPITIGNDTRVDECEVGGTSAFMVTGSELVPSDVAILDLLRQQRSLSIAQLAELTGVTATAVRQRLTRLMGQGLISRVTDRAGRGRPSHRYALTTAGRRRTGANFGDLAVALWEEIRAIQDPDVRAGLIQRLSRRLADRYRGRVNGSTVAARMEAVAAIFNERRVPFVVETAGDAGGAESGAGKQAETKRTEGSRLPVLTALACPYPDLAEQDRAICSLEKLLFTELLGEPVKLSRCRLDGDECCTFEVRGPGTSS